jgi:hypothetical protein
VAVPPWAGATMARGRHPYECDMYIVVLLLHSMPLVFPQRIMALSSSVIVWIFFSSTAASYILLYVLSCLGI